MKPDPLIRDAVERLRAAGATIARLELGAPADTQLVPALALIGKTAPPPEAMAFYSAVDGAKLLWHGEIAGVAAQGSLNILNLLQTMLRAPADDEGEPLEGVLWDAEFPDGPRERLQQMAVFEAIAGRSAHLAYTPDARLYLVEEDVIQPLVPAFDEAVEALLRHAGADGVREALTHADWKARLAADPVLRAIAGA